MENKKMYRAPSADFILLAPAEHVASWSIKPNSGWWNDNSAFWWGKKGLETASLVTGVLGIENEDGDSWTLP